MPMSSRSRIWGLLLSGLATCVAAQEPASPPPHPLPVLGCVDVPAPGRLFERGFAISPASLSPDGYSYAFLHHVPGGILRRKPKRCAFVLDLASGNTKAIPTPKGNASRLGGWDPTGRYLLVASVKPDWTSVITGNWTTYHWIFDVVAARFVERNSFTGIDNGERFRWARPGTYHGEWTSGGDAAVIPMDDGELAARYAERETLLAEEDERRRALARMLAVGMGDAPPLPLGEYVARLDERWTKPGQRDAVISDLFGPRPTLFARRNDAWIPVMPEVEFVSVLDRGLVLVVGRDARQHLFDPARWEVAPLAEPPAAFVRSLEERWAREDFYDETDPLPRDLQYRRHYDTAAGTAYYYHYVTPDRSRLFTLYSFGPSDRVFRVVQLPSAWSTIEPAGTRADSTPSTD